MAGAAFHALLPALSGGISLSLTLSHGDTGLPEAALRPFIAGLPSSSFSARRRSVVGFSSQPWLVVTNSHLPLLVASYLGRRSFRGVLHVRLLSGGGGFALFRGLGTVAGPSHSSYDGCAAHNLCGPGLESSSSGVPSSAAGGALFIPDLLLRSCARNPARLGISLSCSAYGTASHLTTSLW